jgi:catalase
MPWDTFHPDSPNTINKGFPQQAGREAGRGFFTAPGRKASGELVRRRPSTFADHWSQPRLFYNSLSPVEQQFVVDAMRFETSHLSPNIRTNVLKQLNRVSHDVAARVSAAIGVQAPEADDTYYHDNTTAGISIFGVRLPSIATLKVGILASTLSEASVVQATSLKDALSIENVTGIIVAEALADGVDQTYSAAEAASFDGIIVTAGAEQLFDPSTKSSLYPPRKPLQIVTDGFSWGKPLGFLGQASTILQAANVAEDSLGVYTSDDVGPIVESFRDGLAIFKFTDRFAVDGQ